MKTIHVSDMKCMHCHKTISTALKKAGITAEVKLEDKTVTVAEENYEQAKEVIRTVGFNAE